MSKNYYVYILASRFHGAIYIGMTSNLALCLSEHQSGQIKGHAQKYGIKTLVYYEIFEEVDVAMSREKSLKRWRRQWKDNLIETGNPNWEDLSSEVMLLD